MTIQQFQKEYGTEEACREHLHWLHIIISNVKAFVLGTYHGLGEPHLQKYLDEFCYHFNRRNTAFNLFAHITNACANFVPISTMQFFFGKPIFIHERIGPRVKCRHAEDGTMMFPPGGPWANVRISECPVSTPV